MIKVPVKNIEKMLEQRSYKKIYIVELTCEHSNSKSPIEAMVDLKFMLDKIPGIIVQGLTEGSMVDYDKVRSNYK